MPEHKTTHEWVVHIDGTEEYGTAHDEGVALIWAHGLKKHHPKVRVTIQHVETYTIITRHDPVEITDA